jgi:hypothetical protein
MRGSAESEDRGTEPVQHRAGLLSGQWRARAGYMLLGTACLTSPVLLPLELAPLMLVLHGTPLGAAILDRLHLVYIGSAAYCLAALAIACLGFYSAPDAAATSCDRARCPVPVPNGQHHKLHRWPVAHGRRAEDAPTVQGEVSPSTRPIALAESSHARRDVASGE